MKIHAQVNSNAAESLNEQVLNSAFEIKYLHWHQQMAAGMDLLTLNCHSLNKTESDTNECLLAHTQALFGIDKLDVITQDTQFNLNISYLLNDIAQAKVYQKSLKLHLVGPLELLSSMKVPAPIKDHILDKLLFQYQSMLSQLNEAGVDWVEFQETGVAAQQDALPAYQQLIEVYQMLSQVKRPKLMLKSSYIQALIEADSQLKLDNLLSGLSLEGMQVDASHQNFNWPLLLKLAPQMKVISLAVIKTKGAQKTHLAALLKQLQPIYDKFMDKLWLTTVPSSNSHEYYGQKLIELNLLKSALIDYEIDPVIAYSQTALVPYKTQLLA